MPFWIVVIVLVSVIGGLITEYQKNKMKLMNHSRHNESEIEDVRELVNTLKKRIENLEAIAAGEPDEFKTSSKAGLEEFEIDDESLRRENQQRASEIANKNRGGIQS